MVFQAESVGSFSVGNGHGNGNGDGDGDGSGVEDNPDDRAEPVRVRTHRVRSVAGIRTP